ncbi:MAG: hypothetical protein M5U01_21205 [Ardenticatenaceae bacterium]|nr:hypothetical protein [Ardenticatenaceae bacterium]HBY95438.1 hypothetical protein [Chloroflexota bacterium]
MKSGTRAQPVGLNVAGSIRSQQGRGILVVVLSAASFGAVTPFVQMAYASSAPAVRCASPTFGPRPVGGKDEIS